MVRHWIGIFEDARRVQVYCQSVACSECKIRKGLKIGMKYDDDINKCPVWRARNRIAEYYKFIKER